MRVRDDSGHSGRKIGPGSRPTRHTGGVPNVGRAEVPGSRWGSGLNEKSPRRLSPLGQPTDGHPVLPTTTTRAQAPGPTRPTDTDTGQRARTDTTDDADTGPDARTDTTDDTTHRPRALRPMRLCSRLYRRTGYAGIRVGEASHPGPGASRTTARKRRQKAAGASGQTPTATVPTDVEHMLRTMLHQLLEKIMREILQQHLGAALQSPTTPATAAPTTTTTTPTTTSPPTGAAAPKKTKQKRKQPATTTRPATTPAKKPATTGKPPTTKAAQPADQAAPTGTDDDGFTTVKRKDDTPFTLRAADWTDPIVAFAM